MGDSMETASRKYSTTDVPKLTETAVECTRPAPVQTSHREGQIAHDIPHPTKKLFAMKAKDIHHTIFCKFMAHVFTKGK